MKKYHGFVKDYNKHWLGFMPGANLDPALTNENPAAIKNPLWLWLTYKVYDVERGGGLLDVGRVAKRVIGGAVGLKERKDTYKLTKICFDMKKLELRDLAFFTFLGVHIDASGTETSLCTSDEVIVASCHLNEKKSRIISFCASTDKKIINYRFGLQSKIELDVSFSGDAQLSRWVDIATYTVNFGFRHGEGYSYIFGIPQEALGAKAFLEVARNDEELVGIECINSSFGEKNLTSEAVREVEDERVRNNNFLFPPDDNHKGNERDGSTSQPFSWSGFYWKKAEFCTSPGNGKDCSAQFHDCLKIELGRQGYLVELYSTQADHNVCSFTFRMDAVNEKLIYKTQFGPVLLQRSGDSLEISSEGVDPTALGLGVCGVHAEIDGLKFPLASKRDAISKCSATK